MEIYPLPAAEGHLKFLMQSSIDCASTMANLKRKRRVLSSSCKLCGGYETVAHALNYCSVALDQGSLTWRHDSVLIHIVKQLNHRYGSDPNVKIYADISEHKVAGGTIPPHLLTTSARPDLVIADEEKKELSIYELTCPFDAQKNIAAARQRKLARYQSLPRDVAAFRDHGWTVPTLDFIEVCALGSIGPKTKEALQRLFPGRGVFRRVSRKLCRIAVSTSYAIFLARSTQAWGNVPLIELDIDRTRVQEPA